MAGETARGRDQRLLPQLHRIAAAPGQLAPESSIAFHSGVGMLADRSVRRDRAPGDPAAAVEEAAERDGVLGLDGVDVDVHDVGPGVEREAEVAAAAHVHTR